MKKKQKTITLYFAASTFNKKRRYHKKITPINNLVKCKVYWLAQILTYGKNSWSQCIILNVIQNHSLSKFRQGLKICYFF